MNSLKPLLSISILNLNQMSNSLNRCVVSINQMISVRHRRVYPAIRGPPRPPQRGKKVPEPNKYNWIPIYPLDGKYTIEPLKIRKLGGRDPETGRVVVTTVGGGNKKYFRWIDYKKSANEDGSVREEKVFKVRYDPLRTSKLALVGGGDTIRWIIASETMQVGDIIRTFPATVIPRNPVRAKEGDSHPVGALPVGTKVHNVEVNPGEGGTMVKVHGDYAEITQRIGKKNYLFCQTGKRQICIDQTCMVTVGRVSNPYTVNKMCAQRSRWLGKRPRSGAWHRKDGYCGWKNRPPKPVIDFVAKSLTEKKPEPEFYEIQPF